MEPHYYNVDVQWIAERKGIISSPELKLQIEIATPHNFQKELKAFGHQNIY